MVGEKNGSLVPYLFVGVLIVLGIICLAGAIVYMTPPHHEELPNGGYVMLVPHVIDIDLKPLAGDGNVSDDQMELARSILETRFKAYDNTSEVHSFRKDDGNATLSVLFMDLPVDQGEPIATMPGTFEMRMQANGSQTIHVLNSDDIRNVSDPGFEVINDTKVWGVTFNLTDNGSQKLRQACIDTGAITDPADHSLVLLLDGRIVCTMPISSTLAGMIEKGPVNSLGAFTGPGHDGQVVAESLSVCMRSEPMPVLVIIKHYPTVSPGAMDYYPPPPPSP